MKPNTLPLDIHALARRRAKELRDRAISDALRWLWRRLIGLASRRALRRPLFGRLGGLMPTRHPSINLEKESTCRS